MDNCAIVYLYINVFCPCRNRIVQQRDDERCSNHDVSLWNACNVEKIHSQIYLTKHIHEFLLMSYEINANWNGIVILQLIEHTVFFFLCMAIFIDFSSPFSL